MQKGKTPASVTAARDWRKSSQQGELYTLPGCGNVARLRRPSLMAMAAKGTVPNALSNDVMKLLAVVEENPTADRQIQIYGEQAQAFKEIAALSLVEPRLVLDREPDYDKGEITADDLTDQDYVFIWRFVQGRHEDFNPFRVSDNA